MKIKKDVISNLLILQAGSQGDLMLHLKGKIRPKDIPELKERYEK